MSDERRQPARAALMPVERARMRRVRRFAGAAFVLVVLKTATRVLAPRRVTVFVGCELGFLGVAP